MRPRAHVVVLGTVLLAAWIGTIAICLQSLQLAPSSVDVLSGFHQLDAKAASRIHIPKAAALAGDGDQPVSLLSNGHGGVKLGGTDGDAKPRHTADAARARADAVAAKAWEREERGEDRLAAQRARGGEAEAEAQAAAGAAEREQAEQKFQDEDEAEDENELEDEDEAEDKAEAEPAGQAGPAEQAQPRLAEVPSEVSSEELPEVRSEAWGCCQLSKTDSRCAGFEYQAGCARLDSGSHRPGCSRGYWNQHADYEELTGRCTGLAPFAKERTSTLHLPLWARQSFLLPPDYRHDRCLQGHFRSAKDMPTVTIVIPYLMESLLHIKGAIASLLWATNMDLVDEVRFVDDANPEGHVFKAEMQALHPKVRVITNPRPLGLTHSKVVGTEGATSPVIVFAEPHCIFNRYWLEPLLERMAQVSDETVLLPLIDNINSPYNGTQPRHKLYTQAGLNVGGMSLETLTFGWEDLAGRNRSYQEPDPFESPTMPGGILAIRRSWWERSGRYDRGMTAWGGENIEMSLRMWTCGGAVEAVPCSRIFHWFRDKPPYQWDVPALVKNKRRIADVWLDDYAKIFYRANPTALETDVGDVSDRQQLRRDLHCKNFSWYIDHVYPEMRGKIAGGSSASGGEQGDVLPKLSGDGQTGG